MERGYLLIYIFYQFKLYTLSFYFNHSFSVFDNLMYLQLCISVNIRVVYRERACMAFRSGIVFVHRKGRVFKVSMVFVQRKGMAFRVRHGLCTEKRHGLLVQA